MSRSIVNSYGSSFCLRKWGVVGVYHCRMSVIKNRDATRGLHSFIN